MRVVDYVKVLKLRYRNALTFLVSVGVSVHVLKRLYRGGLMSGQTTRDID